MNVPPISAVTPAASLEAKVPMKYTVNSLEELFDRLKRLNIIDDNGKALVNINIPSLPPAIINRLNEKLRKEFFEFYTNSSEDPALLGRANVFSPLDFFEGLSITLVGSSVWHMLGVEFFEGLFSKWGIGFSDAVKEEINARLTYNDIDIRVDCSNNLSLYADCTNLLAKSLLPFLNNKEIDLESLKLLGFLKLQPITASLFVASIGSRTATRAEYSFFLELIRLYLFERDAYNILLKKNEEKIICNSKNNLQPPIDFLGNLVRTNNWETISDLGWSKYYSLVYLGAKTIHAEFPEKLLRYLLSRVPPHTDLGNHLVKLLLHACKNHLPTTNNGVVKLAFLASYELAKQLTPEQFCQFWSAAVKANVLWLPSGEDIEIRGIGKSFAVGNLAPLSTFHLLILADSPLVKNIFSKLSYEELDAYCQEPNPLIKVHLHYKRISQPVAELLFNALLHTQAPLPLWAKLKNHLLVSELTIYEKKLQESLKPKPVQVVLPVPLQAAATALKPKLFSQMKGDEQEFEEMFNEACNKCASLILTTPKTARSEVCEFLKKAKNKSNHSTSHNSFAELILLSLTFKDPLPKENYKLDFTKITPLKKRLEVLYQLNLNGWPHDTVDINSVLFELPYDNETDKWLRYILKERKGLTFQPEAISFRLIHNKELYSQEEIKSWVELLLAYPKPLLKADENLKKFVLSLFTVSTISSLQIAVLRKLVFVGSENGIIFYKGYLSKNDKRSFTLASEAVKTANDPLSLQNYLQTLTPHLVETLISEACVTDPLPLMTSFESADQLQKYVDVLLETSSKIIAQNRRQFDFLLTQIFHFVNDRAADLFSHDTFADFLKHFIDLRKKLTKTVFHLNFDKISSGEKKLEMVSLFDVNGIPYPLFDLSNVLIELSYTPERDEQLRKHIPHISKAPFSPECLAGWINGLFDTQREEDLNKWISLFTNPHLQSIVSPFIEGWNERFLSLPSFNCKTAWSLYETLPVGHKQRNLFFKYFLISAKGEVEHYLQDLCKRENNDELWLAYIQERPSKSLFPIAQYEEGLSAEIRLALFKQLLTLPLTQEEKKTFFKTLKGLKEKLPCLEEGVKTSWVFWLLSSPHTLHIEEATRELKIHATSAQREMWLAALHALPEEQKRELAPKVKAALSSFTLSSIDRIRLIIAFKLHPLANEYLKGEFQTFSLSEKIAVLKEELDFQPQHGPALIMAVGTNEARTKLGDALYSRLITKWILGYAKVTLEYFSKPSLISYTLEERVTLLVQTRLIIHFFSSIDLTHPEIEKECFVSLSRLICRLIDLSQPISEVAKLGSNLIRKALVNCFRREIATDSTNIPLVPIDQDFIIKLETIKNKNQQKTSFLFILQHLEDLLNIKTAAMDAIEHIIENYLQLIYHVILKDEEVRDRCIQIVLQHCRFGNMHSGIIKMKCTDDALMILGYYLNHIKETSSVTSKEYKELQKEEKRLTLVKAELESLLTSINDPGMDEKKRLFQLSRKLSLLTLKTPAELQEQENAEFISGIIEAFDRSISHQTSIKGDSLSLFLFLLPYYNLYSEPFLKIVDRFINIRNPFENYPPILKVERVYELLFNLMIVLEKNESKALTVSYYKAIFETFSQLRNIKVEKDLLEIDFSFIFDCHETFVGH